MIVYLLIINALFATNVFGSKCDSIISKIILFNPLTDIKENKIIICDTLLNKKEDFKESIELDSLALINVQLDSILYKTTEYLKEGTKMGFSITLMRQGDDLYLEIIKGVSNSNLFSYKAIKSPKGYLWGNNKIYGYFKYKDWDFYVVENKPPNNPTGDDFNIFFDKVSVKKIIFEEKNELPYMFENPMWVYQYLSDRLVLLKSVNDKGFFTKPINMIQ